MKVLSVVSSALLGGHTLSALTISKELLKNGHEVIFAGKDGTLTPEIQKSMEFITVAIPTHHHGRPTYFTWKSFKVIKILQKIIRDIQPDIIHAFDARSYIHWYIPGLLEQVPVVGTLCGGIDPYYNLPCSSKLMVFSEEQKDKMITGFGWKKERVDVIRTRLDLSTILTSINETKTINIAAFGFDLNLPKLIMLTSFDDLKIHGIHNLLSSLELLLHENTCQLIFVGGEGTNREEVKTRAKKINDHFNAKRIIFVDPLLDAYKLLGFATIVLGVGRSAFEGMALGKPTIIVGNNGFAGTISPENVQSQAYYNFSGRNQKFVSQPEKLALEMNRILKEPEYAASLGRFGQTYIENEIDVRVGIKKIETVYNEVLLSKYPKRRQQLKSFFQCITPICIDNFLHIPRLLTKNILYRLSNRP